VNSSLIDSLNSIRNSLACFAPELFLSAAIILLVTFGLVLKEKTTFFHLFAGAIFAIATGLAAKSVVANQEAQVLFSGLVTSDSFSHFLKLLFSLSGLLSVIMTSRRHQPQERLPEYYALMITVVLGAHLLVMSNNLLLLFLSLELISIASYALTAFAFSKTASEGSLKYFIFGSVASAVMLYGFSLLYGITGSLTFTSEAFALALAQPLTVLVIIATFFSLAGFLYKIAAVPMHPWAPDVYESASMPVIAFFSVVPKLAGVGILAKFLLALNLSTGPAVDWQFFFALVGCATLAVGNFSALGQKNVKRLMGYSSIAQSGFLLIGVLVFSQEGIHFFLFYATVYVILNYIVFIFLQMFENYGITSIAGFAGVSKQALWPSIFLLVGFIGLTGLPPTAGFTGKLFLFTGLWNSYALTNKPSLLLLFVFGLFNTVIALFYYLRIPYYAFIKSANSNIPENNLTSLNLLGLFLVVLILIFFFSPGLLMGWINKINFAF
jgi:NADH-quinone oxidoreductase subunit N